MPRGPPRASCLGETTHQRRPDDDAVREAGDLARLLAGGDAEPDAHGQVGDGAGPRDQVVGRLPDTGPGAGDAHDRGRVDEAPAVRR